MKGNLPTEIIVKYSKKLLIFFKIFSFQPPHVRRRLKVQDIVQKYKMDLSEPELLAYLFKSSF